MTNKIAEYRKLAGLNQKELGEKLGVAQNTISGWERGYREPDNASMSKLEEILNAPIQHIMGWEIDEEAENEKEMLRQAYGEASYDDYPEVMAISAAADFMSADQRARLLVIAKNAFPQAFKQASNPD